MAIPSRIVALDGLLATVEAFGERRDVSLMLLPEAPALGDYLLIQAGGFAYQKVEPDAAQESLRLFAEVLAHK
jgi:hydrogenase expression/formation protein HypC